MKYSVRNNGRQLQSVILEDGSSLDLRAQSQRYTHVRPLLIPKGVTWLELPETPYIPETKTSTLTSSSRKSSSTRSSPLSRKTQSEPILEVD